jgi:hypothetical protein
MNVAEVEIPLSPIQRRRQSEAIVAPCATFEITTRVSITNLIIFFHILHVFWRQFYFIEAFDSIIPCPQQSFEPGPKCSMRNPIDVTMLSAV